MDLVSEWFTAKETAAYLRVSERQLYRYRQAGIFKAGVHYRHKFPSPTSALLYQVKLCEIAMVETASRNVQTLETAEA